MGRDIVDQASADDGARRGRRSGVSVSTILSSSPRNRRLEPLRYLRKNSSRGPLIVSPGSIHLRILTPASELDHERSPSGHHSYFAAKQ